MPTKNKRKKRKVIRFRPFKTRFKKKHWNLGTVTFGIIFIYLMVNFIMYLNEDTLSTYEVTKNSMEKTITTKGLVLRDETIIKNKADGYLNYYAQEGERVRKKGYVYSVDETGKVHEYLSQTASEEGILDSDSYLELKETISVFNNYYSDNNFYEVYDFKYDLNNTILEITNETTMKKLEQALKDSGITESYQKIKAPASGLISFLEDGYESLTPKNVTKKAFDDTNYKKQQLKTNNLVQKGEPVYKIIQGNSWDIVIPINEEEKKILEEKTSVQVNFLKDDTTLTATVSILDNKDGTYAQLHFTNYLVRYFSDRFLNIEVVLQSKTGLKIPNTALVTREMFRIPIDYLYTDSSSDESLFRIRTLNSRGKMAIKQVVAEVVMKDDKYCYVSTVPISDDSLTKGMILLRNDSKKTFKVSATKKIDGVYCVNKGYAAFKMVNVLYSNEDYSIVEDTQEVNALTIYDHIVLNSNTIHENDKIY